MHQLTPRVLKQKTRILLKIWILPLRRGRCSRWRCCWRCRRCCSNSRTPVILHSLIGFCECPELTREVAAARQMRLIIVWTAVKDVETHPRAAKLRRQSDRAAVLFKLPKLPREVAAAG